MIDERLIRGLHVDLGLGTLNGLDGEMIAVDQIDHASQLHMELPPGVTLPSAGTVASGSDTQSRLRAIEGGE